mmetsp:Transcript_56083/g.121303  ORF Transcript_56083/g.121303 Transcript_56083/m.121303 type:complete len:410 (-) Transcript_56083:70-1299(-)
MAQAWERGRLSGAAREPWRAMATREGLRCASSKSLGSLAQASECTNSTFHRHLQQEAVDLEIEIPRGLRLPLFQGRACARQPQGGRAPLLGGPRGSPRQASRKYSVTVVPRGRIQPPKEVLRIATKQDYRHSLELPTVRFDEPAMDAVIDERHERAVFRMERVMLFDIHRNVPGLLSPRLLPCWQLPGSDGAGLDAQIRIDTAMSAWEARTRATRSRRGELRRFVMPTMSIAQKCQQKAPPREPSWRATGVADARKLIESTIRHVPAECDGRALCDALLEKQRQELREAKELRICDTPIKPPGRKSVLIEPERQGEIEEMRERGKVKLQGLKKQYEQKRQAFRYAKSKRSSLSGFEEFWKNHQAERQHLHRLRVLEEKRLEDEQNATVRKSFAEIMGLGLTGVTKGRQD